MYSCFARYSLSAGKSLSCSNWSVLLARLACCSTGDSSFSVLLADCPSVPSSCASLIFIARSSSCSRAASSARCSARRFPCATASLSASRVWAGWSVPLACKAACFAR